MVRAAISDFIEAFKMAISKVGSFAAFLLIRLFETGVVESLAFLRFSWLFSVILGILHLVESESSQRVKDAVHQLEGQS